jgi:hypothetical protein
MRRCPQVFIHTSGYQCQRRWFDGTPLDPLPLCSPSCLLCAYPHAFCEVVPEQMPNRASACYFPLLQRAEAHLSIVLE